MESNKVFGAELQLFMLAAFQINAFMVFAIIGTVFAVIQLSNAAIGAIVVRDLHLNFIAPSKVSLTQI